MVNNELKPVVLKTSWEELFGNKRDEMDDATRRKRWNQWKRLAKQNGDGEVVLSWTEPNEACRTCKYRDFEWCNSYGLPCNYNPIMNVMGLACAGVGYEESIQSRVSRLDEYEVEALEYILKELDKAKEKHPEWPVNRYEQLAILTEEVGELAKANLDLPNSTLENDFAGHENLTIEAAQVGAMGLRFLSEWLQPE